MVVDGYGHRNSVRFRRLRCGEATSVGAYVRAFRLGEKRTFCRSGFTEVGDPVFWHMLSVTNEFICARATFRKWGSRKPLQRGARFRPAVSEGLALAGCYLFISSPAV